MDENKPVQSIAEIIKGYKLPEGQRKQLATEYSDLCQVSARLVGQSYIVMHKRLEKLFAGKDISIVMMHLRQWTHEASKASNGGLTMNWRMKQYKLAQTKK